MTSRIHRLSGEEPIELKKTYTVPQEDPCKVKAVASKRMKFNFQSMSLVDQISDALTDAILEGRFKSGEQLFEVELQKHFGTSRSPIREAFRVLERRGLLTLISRKGAFVKLVARKYIEDWFPVRATLEALAAFQAYDCISQKDLIRMSDCMAKMEKDVSRGDMKKYREHHFDFHEIIIKASHNDLLMDILAPLRMQGKWLNYDQEFFHEDLCELLKIHRRIFDLFHQPYSPKKRTQLVNLVRKHIEDAMQKYLKHFDAMTARQARQDVSFLQQKTTKAGAEEESRDEEKK